VTKAFLTRPVLAIVCSLVIMICGLVALPTLPIAQYPQIAPPVVTVTAIYTGASPQAVEAQVTTVIEQAVNTVEGLRYVSSTSSQGVSTVTCTFNLGVNLDIAAADVQNSVQSSLGLLPQTVQQLGITVSKNNGSFVMGIAMTSDTKSLSTLDLSNYIQLNVANDLGRVQGVSQVLIFGQRQYSMRIWLNPSKLAQEGLDASDVVSALQEQNVSIAAGSIGAPPAPKSQPYTYTVNALTQLSDPSQFSNIILRANPNGGYVRLADVSRVELGAQSYTTSLRFNGHGKTVGMGVLQYPTANALQVSSNVRAKMEELAKAFPPGIHWEVAFDATTFVNESIREVVITLLLSIVLVILVIFLFLQDPRSTLIPAATIPVSLIGTFFIMKLLGFTINTITLFGLTLATGLVVDDAIVVIENIARHMELNRGKQSGIASAGEAMREITSAVVASSIVLLAVFIPVGFLPGTTGEIYKQFAITIAASISISLFQALTLAPVLSARLLSGEREAKGSFFRRFNAGLQGFRDWYGRRLPGFFRRRWLVAGLFAGALGLTLFLVWWTPQAFLPDEDVGYFITLIQAPEGTSLEGEQAVGRKVEAIMQAQPEVQYVFDVGGFGFSGTSPNRGVVFTLVKPWSERKTPFWCNFAFLAPGMHSEQCVSHSVFALEQRLNGMFYMGVPEAQVFAFNPPAINGIGNFNGFQFELEDRGNVGLPALMGTAYAIMGAAFKDPKLEDVFTQFRINSPQIEADIDRNKAKAIGVPLANIFQTMEVDLGSLYVNNFTYLNRSWQVQVQADAPYRSTVSNLQNLYVRSNQPPDTLAAPTNPASSVATSNTTATGSVMVPLSTLMTAKQVLGPPIISHYNLYRNIELSGLPAPGTSSGDAINEMQKIARSVMPKGVTFEWTGLQLDQIAAGTPTKVVFALAIIFVFLALSAQYENFVDPLIVLLAVPAALLGALGFMNLRSHLPLPFLFDPTLSQDVYAQVGYVMLIGLASKSAILIVEFANQQVHEGATIVQAALRAAQVRLRPILMTSIAFCIAVLPLVFATGAGEAARHSIGTVVFGGMIVSTFLNLAITPVLFVIIKSLELRGRRPGGSNGRTDGQVSGEISTEPTGAIPTRT
jgi:HAE1 family hydrophobic/amphiphilic exporter-1